MTLAQFFEMRYSRRFRIFAGVLTYASGILNYAIFPAVGGRFLLYYCQFPDTVVILGVGVSTYGLLMAFFLGVALLIVLRGGQVTTMVTDCAQGVYSYFAFAAIIAAIFGVFSMTQFKEAMLSRGPGLSFIDPFDTAKLTDFNILFVLIGIFSSVYSRMAWQGTQAYNCSAASPHEQKMGAVLGTWRGGFMTLMIMLLALAGYTCMNHPAFAPQAQAIQQEVVQRIQFDSSATTAAVQTQMLVPIAVRHLLPVGVIGVFLALMIFHMVGTDTTYMHSWGSIFVQDVVLPFRKKPFTPEQQIRWLRWSILGVAAFAWVFSYFFSQTTYLLMFMALTATIYLGGAGACIIGGLYWKRGTTAGAWSAMGFGAGFGVVGFLLNKYWATGVYPWLAQHAPGFLAGLKSGMEGFSGKLPFMHWVVGPEKCPISGQEIYFLTMLVSLTLYVVVSLLTCREPFNLDRLLHRGVYTRDLPPGAKPPPKPPRSWRAFLGITPEYTRGDRILAWSVFLYTMLQFGLFLFVAISNMISRWPKENFWLYWKYVTVVQSLLVGLISTIWFSWGGVRGMWRLFGRLDKLQRDELDNGRVVGHVSADEVERVGEIQKSEGRSQNLE
jgi:SSS family solute:Na+ symporter